MEGEREEKRGEERERGEDDKRRGEEDDKDGEPSESLFDSCPSRPQCFFSQDRCKGRENRQVISPRCINIRTPTCLDRLHDEAEEDGEEEEDGLVILEQPLKAPVVWVVPLVKASSIVNVSN